MGKEERRDKCGGTELTWMNNHLLLLPLFPAFLLHTFYSVTFSIHLCCLSIWLFLSIAVFLSRCAQPQPPDSTLQTDLPRSVVGVLTDLLWVDSTIECESLGREEEEGKKGWSGISWWKEVGIRWWQGQEGRGGGWDIGGRETTMRLRVSHGDWCHYRETVSWSRDGKGENFVDKVRCQTLRDSAYVVLFISCSGWGSFIQNSKWIGCYVRLCFST